MRFDAIILSGGRASRLGGVDKAALDAGGRTLLHRVMDAASAARRIVIVGPPSLALAPETLVAREDPAFGGPAAGVAAGLDTLASQAAPLTLVLACDMPGAARAVEALLSGLRSRPGGVSKPSAPAPDQLDGRLDDADDADGVIALDENDRLQPLAAIYATAALSRVVQQHREAGDLHGLSMFSLIGSLSLGAVRVPAGSTADVDTWRDAARLGVRHPSAGEEEQP
ncbi:NTP transferase domain-containing protein [Microbacterium sp. STN6]|uniref:molybdenum cofactor guanylyltransferase n=1 Tax=Microbacterium sp. STN6 TaxID=2995588 RepID=UPI002260E4E4|nr:NTP transferase domain-containing protein [Microbacterium sp. STN6]MCX7520885.1 NTP transferase domain-containing protein [Microbacterium sp. STN6]